MASRVKCWACLGCMIARWVNNKVYYYCDLCKLWYGKNTEGLILVEDPNKERKENE